MFIYNFHLASSCLASSYPKFQVFAFWSMPFMARFQNMFFTLYQSFQAANSVLRTK